MTGSPNMMGVARRLLTLMLGLLVVIPTGCTWDRTEPGLFRTRPPAAPTSHRPSPKMPEPTNPALPVAGEAVWTTGDGNDVTVRIAVHAVRRAKAATLLDWSITPLTAPGARFGDRASGTADLGLTTDSGSDLAVVLIDSAAQHAYRPLRHAHRSLFNHCLCTPVWRVQQSLRLGETSLLQVAYPPLPETTAFVDVAFTTLVPFFHLPVTPAGQVPTARQPTDLTRPAGERRTASAPIYFRYPGPPVRQLSIQIDRVVAGAGLTSVQWTIRSLDDQVRSTLDPYGPPVSGQIPAGVNVVDTTPASGLTLRPAGSKAPPAAASWMTTDINGRTGYECVCTQLGLWARSLASRYGAVQVVTNYPALPAGTRRVDVNLPNVSTLAGVPVETAADGAAALGPPAVRQVRGWFYPDDDPPSAWSTADWPTRVADPGQLSLYTTRVDRIGPLPHA